MLIIVVGESCTGKTYFIENRMGEIKGYDTKRGVKIFPAFQSGIVYDEFLNMVYNHRSMANNKLIDFDDMIIETSSLKQLKPEVVANAHYIVFTTYDAMQQYFTDSKYGNHSTSVLKTMTQVNKFHNEKRPVCIWDSWNKLFV
ncbi:Hypothetical protein PACV_221 [Pacmanvirus A23]|uniref:Hypothetical protein n=1 Tax=Pacmanvirus A23 TaxID=1932881 RepID=UPI000A095CF3|nr:Hypothetical protein B9W72_gp219 [Pacmanvirus A23]SIP85936.1 Hypothetical protein PACV_221 [Pacmanvirus A23]